MFKSGDKVKVIRPVGDILLYGDVFTVVEENGGMVAIEGRPQTQRWFSHRFELVEEQDMTNYPTDLNVGDVLVSSTGREYTVASVDKNNGMVSYAYIPAGSNDNKIKIDTKYMRNLHWVHRVKNKQGQQVWPKRQVQVGDDVKYNGKTYKVVRRNSRDVLRLERTEVQFVNLGDVEAA